MYTVRPCLCCSLTSQGRPLVIADGSRDHNIDHHGAAEVETEADGVGHSGCMPLVVNVFANFIAFEK